MNSKHFNVQKSWIPFGLHKQWMWLSLKSTP